MSSTTSYRLSGVALLVGSLLSIAYYLSEAFVPGNDLASLTSPLVFIGSIIGFIGAVLTLLGLPGIYLRQRQQAGIIGLLGFLFLWYVTLFQGVIIPFTNITFIPLLTSHLVGPAVVLTPPSTWIPFNILSMVSEVLGILLLAIATLRARVFPRWTAWLLIATLVIGIVSFVPFIPQALSNLVAIIASIAIAGFGYALLQPERQEGTQFMLGNIKKEAHA
ncbi:hypothetical protein [Dictyobacter formicarum]|uniref:Uncharacterized protein n=1 Tax=Dictyobacter formicarum TaxID=2778368 RepID=A0ABQ3VG21_9CHLR|nr:hypothetical protein [Dictyobacter formicarum]GHO84763.1 hypothetical protein KSZ_27690 [Dictyobacter formicarum]